MASQRADSGRHLGQAPGFVPCHPTIQGTDRLPTPEDLLARCLRYEDMLFDRLTELPTLSVVMDQVRGLLESISRAGLVFLTVDAPTSLEEVIGWEEFDRLIISISKALVEMKQRILRREDVIAISGCSCTSFLVILSPPRDGHFLHLKDLETVGSRILGHLTALTKDGAFGSASSSLSFQLGYDFVENIPKSRLERRVEQAVRRAMAMSINGKHHEIRRQDAELDEILRTQRVETLLQPIVFLDNRAVLGYEALTRGPRYSALEKPHLLFKVAARTNQCAELERICLSKALGHANSLQKHHKLFLNVNPRTVASLRGSLIEILRSTTIDARNVVLEVTERDAVEDFGSFLRTLNEIRSFGFQFAVDDACAGYSSLQTIMELRPEYLKLDQTLVHNLEHDFIKQDILTTLIKMAHQIDSQVTAEGIETEQQREILLDLGVKIGQGYLFGHPSRPRGTAPLS